MKRSARLILILAVTALIAGTPGCFPVVKVHKNHPDKVVVKKVPPGQAKKMTGQKSAKAFAPGQRKKK